MNVHDVHAVYPKLCVVVVWFGKLTGGLTARLFSVVIPMKVRVLFCAFLACVLSRPVWCVCLVFVYGAFVFGR